MSRTSFRRGMLLVLVLILAMSSITVSAAEETTEKTTTLKVGYTLNYATIKSPMVTGEEGYGYEYLNQIFEYIDGDYELEFVYCEWSNITELLLDGTIDIFGPITYTEYNAESYLYTDMSFGDNFIFLSTLTENQALYNSYEDIDGSTIAVQENNPNEYLLYEYLEKNGFTAEIVYFTDNDYEAVMEEGGYDYCLCSSLQTLSSLSPVASLGSAEFYYVTSYENADLIEEINEAMVEVHEQEYMYQVKLYLEYYDYAILSDSYVTEDEYALLQEQDTYYVGIMDVYGAICNVNEDGEFEGIAVDVMDMIAENAGIEYVLVELTDELSDSEIEEIDISFSIYDDEWMKYAIISDSFCAMPFVLMERAMGDGDIIENVGVLGYYGITEIIRQGYLFDREIVEFDNILDMQDAYNEGEIDSLILTTSNMNLIRSDFVDSEFLVNNLDMSLNISLTFPSNYSEEKVEIFNKIIEQLDSAEVDASLLQHSTDDESYIELGDIIREYPQALVLLIAVLALVAIIIVVVYMTKRRQYLSQLLNYDQLTGLHSGHRFANDVKEAMEYAACEQQYDIITIDIDNFKYINDVFGYEKGNIVIQKVANALKSDAPEILSLARNSSDIFMIFLRRKSDQAHRELIIEEERSNLFDELKSEIGDTYKISFSIGVYEIEDRKLDINFMIDCANIARLQGKNYAYTTINKYDGNMEKVRKMSTDIVTNMVAGITNHEFLVYYQPKVTLKDKAIVGAEALVRWNRNGVLIPPNDFIPIFEKNGFIEKLDLYVLEEVCNFIYKHPEVPKISVNLSGVTVLKKNIENYILDIVDTYNIPHEKLEFEITETAFVGAFQPIVEMLEVLRANGFSISMDDFGVGISTLSRLKNIPLDILKIDREFIWDSMNNTKDKTIVKNIINLAKDLNLETIAEGIETDAHEAMLAELSCDMGQGYKYSRPLPAEEFLRWIHR